MIDVRNEYGVSILFPDSTLQAGQSKGEFTSDSSACSDSDSRVLSVTSSDNHHGRCTESKGEPSLLSSTLLSSGPLGVHSSVILHVISRFLKLSSKESSTF